MKLTIECDLAEADILITHLYKNKKLRNLKITVTHQEITLPAAIAHISDTVFPELE